METLPIEHTNEQWQAELEWGGHVVPLRNRECRAIAEYYYDGREEY